MCFLFSINGVHPYPLSSLGELSSRFLLFPSFLYTTKELHAFNNYHVLTMKFFLISNSNLTEWSTIQGVIERVISKSEEREARGRF